MNLIKIKKRHENMSFIKLLLSIIETVNKNLHYLREYVNKYLQVELFIYTNILFFTVQCI